MIQPASKLQTAPSANPQKQFFFSRGKGLPPKAADPTPFKPTRLGLNVTRPDFPAGPANANAYLLNNLVAVNHPYRKIYLFVDKISTGWTLGGNTAQTNNSRTWYPHNLTQDPVQIMGHVANQYEFDRIARFVAVAINSSLGVGGDLNMYTQNNWFQYITFRLFKPTAGQVFNHTVNIDWGIVPLQFQGGHERFKFAPDFTIAAKVIDDRSDKNRASFYKKLATKGNDYTAIFGDFTQAGPYVAGTTPTTPAHTTKARQSSVGSDSNSNGNWQSTRPALFDITPILTQK